MGLKPAKIKQWYKTFNMESMDLFLIFKSSILVVISLFNYVYYAKIFVYSSLFNVIVRV